MPTILLIRHAENDYMKKGRLAGRLPGVHLSENGCQQAQAAAEALGRKFPEKNVKALYSSPLERTMETAAPIAAALGLEVIPFPGLLETDIGEWQGKSVKGLSRLKVWKIVQNRPSLFRFPGGETFADTQQRISQALSSLCTQHEAKDILICVTHADPIKLAVAYFTGIPLDLFQRLSVAPASITTLSINEMDVRLLNLNVDLALIQNKP